MFFLLLSFVMARTTGDAMKAKGTGALQGVKPTKRAKPKVELASAKKEQKVSQSTIDSMKTMGMSKAIQKANSGNASSEFVEGAKRMYGGRIKPVMSSSSSVSRTAEKKPISKPGPVVAARQASAAKKKDIGTSRGSGNKVNKTKGY